MTPSNPDNQQPLIYRICDAAGVFHLVAPINHTHPQDEIAGLIAALAAKANASDVQTALAIINTELGGKMPKISVGGGSIPTDKFLCSDPVGNAYCSPFGPSNFILPVANPTAGNFPKIKADGTMEDSGKKPSDFAEASATEAALANKQDTLTFDTTPTANSTNPVTSGGVKIAIDNAVRWNGLEYVVYEGTPIDIDWWFQDGHSQMTFLLEAYQHTTLGEHDVNEMFSTGNTGDHIYWQNGEVAVPDDGYAIVRVYRKEFTGGTVRYFAIAEVCNDIY